MKAQSLDFQTLCDLLIDRGLLTTEQARDAQVKESAQRQRLIREQKRTRAGRHGQPEVTPAEILASLDLPVGGAGETRLGEDAIAQVVAEEAEIPYQKIDPLKLDMKLITQVLSRPFARRHSVLVLGLEGNTLKVAVSDPFDSEVLEGLRRMTGYAIAPVVASKADIQRTIT